MDDMSYQALKSHLLASLDVASNDLEVLGKAFTKIYTEFQTDCVKQVTVEPIPETCFNWVRSKTSNINKVLLFFHGGGYTMGSTQDHLELIAQWVVKTNVSVLSVDYRLCPTHLYPAPLEDAQSAYLWLLKNGFQNTEIAFSGISAGALLVTQLILRCQLQGLPQPKAAIVLSGPRNLKFDSLSCKYNINRDWISPERLQNIKKYYLPKCLNKDLTSLLSPIDFKYDSYPTTFFQAGDYELLLDDSILFYQKLRQNNFDVYLNVVPELPHCWQLFSKVYEPGRIAIINSVSFINNYF